MIIHGEFYDGIVGKPDLDEVLEHHGVMGMKWGVRKQPETKGGIKKRKKLTSKQKIEKIKRNVKAYEDQWDKAERLENKASEANAKAQREIDAAWKETKKRRKKIGKTPISRVYRTIKYPKDKNVKAYEDQWDKAERLENKASEANAKAQHKIDTAWKETKKLRKKIGKTPISRVYRTIKYGD